MWFWMSDFVSKEAITYDLEAYHRVGVGGVLLFPNYEHVAGWGWSFAPRAPRSGPNRSATRGTSASGTRSGSAIAWG